MSPEDFYEAISKNVMNGGRQLGGIVSRFVKPTPVKPAQRPGTLDYSGNVQTEDVHITVIDYDSNNHEQREVSTVEECCPYRRSSTTTWINVSGVSDVEIIEKLGRQYDIHPLVLEDIVHTHQRPKLEDHDDYAYLVLRMLSFDDQRRQIISEQVSLLIGKGWILTFQEKAGDVFDPVRERARNAQGRIRKYSSDYLAYTLIDAIVDHYFIVLEKIGDRIEILEEVIRKKPTPDALQRIHNLKREMIFMRKSIWPLREVINQLYKDELPLIKKETRIYLRDVYDHTVQIMETVDSFRDMLSGLQDLYLSMVSNRMNDVMKVLTIIATIFIPPTFVAGIYGMNFDHMPELHTPYGYFFVLGVMGFCIAGMLIYFRKKKWL